MVDQTKKSMAEGLSELATVQKLWSTVVLVRFRNCFKIVVHSSSVLIGQIPLLLLIVECLNKPK